MTSTIGQVHRVVPVCHGLGLVHVALLVNPHKVAMDGDVFEQLLIAARDGEADILLRPQLVELRAFQERYRIRPRFPGHRASTSGVSGTRDRTSITSASMNSTPCSRATDTR